MKLKDLYIKLLKEGKKNQINELEIRYLLCFYQGYPNIASFYLKLDDEVKRLALILNDFERLKTGYPIAYIIKETDFLSKRYIVSEDVLIPRVETEELLVLAIKRIEQYLKKEELKILDVGTGSGVLAIELASRYHGTIMATDINKKALLIAKKNANRYKAKVDFYYADTYPNNDTKFNVIISNPPYIKYKKDVAKDVLKYEPHSALFLKKDNDVYEKILKAIKMHSARPCLLIFEIAPDIKEHLNELMNKYLLEEKCHFIYSKDINNKDRFLTIILE